MLSWTNTNREKVSNFYTDNKHVKKLEQQILVMNNHYEEY